MRTFSPKPADIQRKWWVVDAEDMVLGRLSTEVARILRGKHKPIFAQHSTRATTSLLLTPTKSCLTSNKAERTFHTVTPVTPVV